jgi:hypothetical protein
MGNEHASQPAVAPKTPAVNPGKPQSASLNPALAALRGATYEEGTSALKPGAAQSTSAAPLMRDGQKNADSTVKPPAPVPAATGLIVVDDKATDVANKALVEMKTGTPIQKNTAARIVAGTHKLAYLEDLAVDPKSDELLAKWGYDKASFTVKLDPWTGGQMIVQNNAAGFAVGNNIVGSRSQSVDFWKNTLLCHEVSHIANNDNATDASSFERYKGEFRAYWVGGFQKIADEADRAKQVRAHVLRDYVLFKSKYDSDAAFKAKVDAHVKPDASDNLDNHT